MAPLPRRGHPAAACLGAPAPVSPPGLEGQGRGLGPSRSEPAGWGPCLAPDRPGLCALAPWHGARVYSGEGLAVQSSCWGCRTPRPPVSTSLQGAWGWGAAVGSARDLIWGPRPPRQVGDAVASAPTASCACSGGHKSELGWRWHGAPFPRSTGPHWVQGAWASRCEGCAAWLHRDPAG